MGRLKESDLAADDRRQRKATLGDMAVQGLDVFCWCNRCGHNRVLATHGLLARLGAEFPVPEVGTRLRCSACDSKDIATRPNWRGLGPVTRHFGAGVDADSQAESSESEGNVAPASARDLW